MPAREELKTGTLDEAAAFAQADPKGPDQMKYPVALILGLWAVIAAGCASQRANVEPRHAASAQQNDKSFPPVVIEGIRPFAF